MLVVMASARINRLAREMAIQKVDELVLSTVNASYRRTIDAAALAGCLAGAEAGKWPVHIATFFTEVSLDLVLSFAAVHGLSESQLVDAYSASKRRTGERNADLEARFGSVAEAAS